MSKSYILLTGGGGYIASHIALQLLEAGERNVLAIDNFTNCVAPGTTKPESLRRVEAHCKASIAFETVDIRDREALRKLFESYSIACVIHLAALKAVGESVAKPLSYYDVNVCGSVALLDVMRQFNVRKLIYSSSATVYGEPKYLPIDEQHATGQGITNPYGRSKYFVEEILKDVSASESGWKVIILRYFNPVGNHESGIIGEDPQGPPNNLMPYVAQVASGRRAELSVFGADYKTKDGTGVRDYIHVVDLAQGHVAAMNAINELTGPYKIYNLGTGCGFSVLEMVNAVKKASNKDVPYKIVERRAGDVPEVYSKPDLAEKELNWKAVRNLDDMCRDLWAWQSQNPNGFSQ